MLIPFVVLGWTVFYSLQSHKKVIDHLMTEVSTEKDPLMRLQALSVQALQPVNLNLMKYETLSKKDFIEPAKTIDLLFKKSLKLDFDQVEKIELLEKAQQNWQKIKDQVFLLFSEGVEENQKETITKIIFDNNMELQEHLSAFQITASDELHKYQITINEKRFNTYMLILVTSLIGLSFSIVISLLLARSILRPMQILNDGTQQLANGNLKHRLQIENQDELGKLMETFNYMAQRLQQNQETLSNLATRDSLTGLYNHKEFFRILHEELERSERYSHPVSLLMLDLDNFKNINDSKGHLAGDAILRKVSEIIMKEIRNTDFGCRYGGDEFAVLLPETDGEKAYEMADRLLKTTVKTKIPLKKDDTISFGISIGLATYPDDGQSMVKLVSAADNALYIAKDEGKNTIICAGTYSKKQKGQK